MLTKANKKEFLKGANAAYEQIIVSFAKGDKKSLKGLLGQKSYSDFSKVIDERKEKILNMKQLLWVLNLQI